MSRASFLEKERFFLFYFFNATQRLSKPCAPGPGNGNMMILFFLPVFFVDVTAVYTMLVWYDFRMNESEMFSKNQNTFRIFMLKIVFQNFQNDIISYTDEFFLLLKSVNIAS